MPDQRWPCIQHVAYEHTPTFKVGWKFERRDLWVGVYWTRALGWPKQRQRHSEVIYCPGVPGSLTLYVCLVPCLPIIITIPRALRAAWSPPVVPEGEVTQ